MKLSVVILNYNVRYFLELCILSVQKAIENIDAEIIVVDNNSPDDSCEMVKTRFPDIHLIENKENSGFPKGNNIGVAAAKGEYLCILNPDTVVAEDTFSKILAFAENTPDCGIVGCKLIDGTGRFLPESKRGIPTPWVAFTKISGLHKIMPHSGIFGKYYAGHLHENQTGKVDVLVGAFMVVKRDLYLETGGFDQRFFMYGEDIDFCYSVLKKGKSNYYFPETAIIHYKGESTVKDGRYMKRFGEAMEIFYQKNFASDTFASFFFSLFMKAGIMAFSLLKAFRGKQKSVKKPENHILISANETLKHKVEAALRKKISLIDPENEKALISQTFSDQNPTEMILDQEILGFSKCIAILEAYKNKGLTFKIIPETADFLIGSNSSNERGEVIKTE